ncbi:hypothetical protein KIN20_021242 [Parelaphostrongylus tenuis]|uniref:Uncharacterized protein n=1 Tax=Parelaphostrongylus tenuis TaxID=148309 RepID=A0AAD5MNM5_PARTN|nr:hypothetical protein KIN20_021242 [Parelaphostrongylus tenuis]
MHYCWLGNFFVLSVLGAGEEVTILGRYLVQTHYSLSRRDCQRMIRFFCVELQNSCKTETTTSEITYHRTKEVFPANCGISSTSRRRSGGDNIYQTTFGTRSRARRDDQGITIVNVYSNDKPGKCARFVQERKSHEPLQCDTTCIVTEKERQQQEDTTLLPYWNIASAAARIKQEDEENQFKNEHAVKAWKTYLSCVDCHRFCRAKHEGQKFDDLLEQPQCQQDGRSCYRRSRRLCRYGSCDQHRYRGLFVNCDGKACDAAEGAVCPCMRLISKYASKKAKIFEEESNKAKMRKPDEEDVEISVPTSKKTKECKEHVQDRVCRRRHRSAPPEVGRPFYGTTELEKCSLNAINHLLKAEKELRRVEFTAGSILPQARQYIDQVDAIQQNLKLFNTQLREVQKQTNEILEQKGARHFHFLIEKSKTKTQSTDSLPQQ